MEPLILTVNSGSESRKYGLFKGADEIAHFQIEKISTHVVGTMTVKNRPAKEFHFDSLHEATENILKIFCLESLILSVDEINAVGVRIVAPSAKFLEHQIIDQSVTNALDELSSSAPLHLQAVKNEIAVFQTQLPSATFYAISDSNFHSHKPDYAWNYSIPLEMADRFDIKKFGYHGLSISSCLTQLSSVIDVPANLVICHLGGGASVSAIKNGLAVDCTMGFSPLEGLAMATRSGSIDTLAALKLAKANNFNLDELIELLNHKSGLLGISGASSDIRELIKLEHNGDYRARLALNIYVINIQKAIGAMSAVLGGINALVLTGTVGIRSFEIRHRIISQLSYLGLNIDDYQNNRIYSPKHPCSIQSVSSTNSIFVITPNEDSEIARHTKSLYTC